MNRFSRSNLAIALIAMYAQYIQQALPAISSSRPERLTRSRGESSRRITAAQAKRERRRLRARGSST